jgi:replicative DNA helicase
MNQLANIEAEQYCIGAMLINNDCIETVSSIVHPNDFTDTVCRDLFFLIMAVRGQGMEVDIITLSAKRDTLSGGQMTIAEAAEIQRESATSSNVEAFANNIRELSQLRNYRTVLHNAIAAIERGKNPADLINAAQHDIAKVADYAKPIDVKKIADFMPALIDDITHRMDSGGGFSGIGAGYPDLDRIICGMRGGHMVVVAGRPGTGKTTLAMNIAEHACGESLPVLVFSLEMSSLELTRRMLSSAGRVPLNAIDTGKIEEHTIQITAGAQKIKGMPLWICDRGGLGIGQIRTIARFQKRMNKTALIVIDYIGLVRTTTTKQSTRSQELGEISRQCKEMAKELDVPVIVLAQLNRELDKTDRDPRLSDLRDSGEIEQDADIVAFVTKSKDDGVSRIVVAKHRHSKTGDCLLLHRGEFSRFDSMANGYTPAPPRKSAGDY